MRAALLTTFAMLLAGPAFADALKASIPDGISKVRPAIKTCGDASLIGGTVKVQVKVGADGKVGSVAAAGSRDAKLNACVADAVKTATFAKTDKGGTFDYSFPLGTKLEANGDLGDAIWGDGISKVWSQVWTCGNATKIGGEVRARFVIDAKGNVTSVKTEGSKDEQLQTCIATALKTATFKPTPRGGSFSYKYTFVSNEPLDRKLVERGIEKIKAQLLACGETSLTTGTFTIEGKAFPDGALSATVKTTTGDLAISACMYGVLETAKFETTPHGGQFTHALELAPKKRPAKQKPAKRKR